jgi:hypothetical protein
MDNPDNQNCPMNPIQNANIFSPYKDSPSKFPPQIKDPKYLFQYSPFQSHINSTPAKNNEFNSCYTPLGETPLPGNYGFQLSPFTNNNRADTSYRKNQYQRGQIDDSSPFKPMNSPNNNNSRISEKK